MTLCHCQPAGRLRCFLRRLFRRKLHHRCVCYLLSGQPITITGTGEPDAPYVIDL